MNAAPETLKSGLDRAFSGLRDARESFSPQLILREVGTVTNVSIGIATVSGLPGVGFDELVRFPRDLLGIAFNVDEDEIGVILLGDYQELHAGDEVERTGRVMDVAVGDGLLGRVIDPLGQRARRSRAGSNERARCRRAPRAGHHGPRVRQCPVADRPEGRRRAHSNWAWAARIDPR